MVLSITHEDVAMNIGLSPIGELLLREGGENSTLERFFGDKPPSIGYDKESFDNDLKIIKKMFSVGNHKMALSTWVIQKSMCGFPGTAEAIFDELCIRMGEEMVPYLNAIKIPFTTYLKKFAKKDRSKVKGKEMTIAEEILTTCITIYETRLKALYLLNVSDSVEYSVDPDLPYAYQYPYVIAQLVQSYRRKRSMGLNTAMAEVLSGLDLPPRDPESLEDEDWSSIDSIPEGGFVTRDVPLEDWE